MSTVADRVLANARVLTMVEGAPPRPAVALAGDRVLATGSEVEIARFVGPATVRHDLGGRTVVPGLVDAHAHLEREGLKTLRPSLARCARVADVLDVVRREAARLPAGQWIVTMPVGAPPYFFEPLASLAEGRLPTRDELDTAAPAHPVAIPGAFGNWGVPPTHGVLNSRAIALNRSALDACPDGCGIRVERDGGGEPTGRIVETNHRPLSEFLILPQVPAFGFADRVEGLRRSLATYHAFGTTTVYEGHGSAPESIAVFRHLWERGELTVRARLCVSPTWDDAHEARLAMRDWLAHARGRGLGDPWLSVSGVFIGLGGSAVMAKAARRALPNTGWAGFVEWSNGIDDFRDQAWLAAEFDLRVHSVVLDRLGEVLDVFEAIDARFPLAGRRWVVEHVGRVSARDIERLRRLEVLVTTIPVYMLWKNGHERLADVGDGEDFVPQRRLLEAGLTVAAGSDNIPPSCFAALWASVVRRTRVGDRVIGPGQSLDRLQALATVTSNAARLSFEEGRIGTLEPGSWADLAVLSDDPLTVDAEALAQVRSTWTLASGRTVHGGPVETE